jgi:Flp pilus assembly protein TadD
MRQLRDTGDVAKTLAQLNTYDDLYRQGRLAPEARLLRAQVLLRANRQTEALSVLDPLLLGGDAVTRPTTALRGDLRAAHGRCADAAVDFTLVIGPDRTDALAERALYARAVCRSQLGDVDGARADARTYLRLFPRGTHGGEVQRFISSTPGGP